MSIKALLDRLGCQLTNTKIKHVPSGMEGMFSLRTLLFSDTWLILHVSGCSSYSCKGKHDRYKQKEKCAFLWIS